MEKIKKLFKTKASKNIIFSLLNQVVTIVVGLIVPRLIIKTYGSETNGLINSITQFLGYITLLDLGFGPVVKSTLYGPLKKKDKKQIANIITAAGRFFRRISYVFIGYIIFLCVFMNTAVASDLGWWETASLVLIISLSTFFEYFIGLAYSLFIEADKRNYVLSLVKIATSILNAVITVVLIRCGSSIQIVKLMASMVYIVRPIFYYLYVHRKYDLNLKDADPNFEIKEKSVALAQHISGIIHGKTDTLLLSLFVNQIMVSVYSVYYLVMNALQSLVSNIANSLAGHFGQMIASEDVRTLRKTFGIYEVIFSFIITVVFGVTFALIVPFVELYTQGITDADYVQPVFAAIITVAFYLHSLKCPYNSLVNAAGLFRDNRKGSIIEAALNLGISLVLIFPLGIKGVAIGTLISVLYRYIVIVRLSSKKVLKRKNAEHRKVALVSGLSILILIFLYRLIGINISTYSDFAMVGILYVLIGAIVAGLIYGAFYSGKIKKLIKERKK